MHHDPRDLRSLTLIQITTLRLETIVLCRKCTERPGKACSTWIKINNWMPNRSGIVIWKTRGKDKFASLRWLSKRRVFQNEPRFHFDDHEQMLHNLMLDVTRKIYIKFKVSKSRAAEEICYCLQLCFEVVNMLTMNSMCSVRLCNKLEGRSWSPSNLANVIGVLAIAGEVKY